MARVLDTKRSRFLLGGLVLAHLVLISRQVERGGGSSLLGQTVFAVLSPLQRMVACQCIHLGAYRSCLSRTTKMLSLTN